MAGRKRVDTGFKSLRDLAICLLGGWTFYVQVSRPEPNLRILGICLLMMVLPTGAALYRVVNAIYGTSGRLLSEMESEKEDP